MFSSLSKSSYSLYSFKLDSKAKQQGIGDVFALSRDKICVGPVGCMWIRPKCSHYIMYGCYSTGVLVRSALANVATESDKDVSFHENLHSAPIVCMCGSEDGGLLVTGSGDMSVRVWSFRTYMDTKKLEHTWTLAGHSDTVTCVDYCAELSLIVSGSKDRSCLVWDSRQGRLVRCLGQFAHAGKAFLSELQRVPCIPLFKNTSNA